MNFGLANTVFELQYLQSDKQYNSDPEPIQSVLNLENSKVTFMLTTPWPN